MKRLRPKAYVRTAIVGLVVALLAGCSPLYTLDASITSTPATQLNLSHLETERVAVMGLVAPANLQGFNPSLSLALVNAIAKVRPPFRAIPAYETTNLLNQHRFAKDYGDLLSGFVLSGILDQQRLRRIGSALCARYLLLPGLAEFDQSIIDKFDFLGVKLLRNRVTTLRLWLQLWDAQTGQILWESSGEVTAVTQLINTKKTVPVDEIAQKLWLQMIQEGLFGAKTETRLFLRD